MRNVVKTVKDCKGVFVDPENVNSTVRYVFETELFDDGTSSFSGSVHFGDCTRVLSWDAYSDQDSRATLLAKVDKAIAVLRGARDTLVLHGVFAEEFKKEYEKRAKPKAKGRKKGKKRA